MVRYRNGWHYAQAYGVLIGKIYQWRKFGGEFVFSVEHPVFTSEASQDWIYDIAGNKLHWLLAGIFMWDEVKYKKCSITSGHLFIILYLCKDKTSSKRYM